jgi:segregation and condensation protein B
VPAPDGVVDPAGAEGDPNGAAGSFVDADPSALDAAAGIATDGAAAAIEGAASLEGAAAAESAEKVDIVRRHLRGLLEALLFVTDRPMKVADLADVARAEAKECRAILEELSGEYRAAARGFQLDELAGGWQLRTAATFAPFVREMTAQKPVKLTRAQVETLAIIAYRQPITRPEIEDVRGVDAGPVVKLLLDRDLVRVLGKKDEPGRPLLYGTTGHFLQFFGLKSLRDLPTLREFTELSDESREVVERELGEVLPEPAVAVVGDANVAAADVDPLATDPPPPAPEASADVGAGAGADAGAGVDAGAGADAHEHERAHEHEDEKQEDEKREDEKQEDEKQEDEKAEEKGTDEAPAPGGSSYDPSDEELYPDDDDEDFDDEDDEDDEDDDEEDGDEDEE